MGKRSSALLRGKPAIISELDYCRKCELCMGSLNRPSRGNGSGLQCFHIIESVSKADNTSKLVLTGESGIFLREALNRHYLYEASYFTSLTKCYVPYCMELTDSNCKACISNLGDELKALNPVIIITYGLRAYNYVTGFAAKSMKSIYLKPIINYNRTYNEYDPYTTHTNARVIIPAYKLELYKSYPESGNLDDVMDIAKRAYKKFINPNFIL